VVMIALAKDPHRRFVNVRAFAQAFEQATLQNASPHPSLLASQIMPPGPNISSGLPAMGGTITYVPDANAKALNNNMPATGMLYSASGQPIMPGSGSYGSGMPNSYATGSAAMSGQGTGWGQGMPYGPGGDTSGQYGNPSFGLSGKQSGHYGNGPLSQIRPGEMNQVGGTFQTYNSQGSGDGQKRLISRRKIIAGVVGLVTVSSALTWAVASRQGSENIQVSETTSLTRSGNTSSTPYTYPTPTAAVPPQLTYKGQQGYIWSVAWSPDGAYIVSGSDDGTAHVWNCNNGSRVTAYRSHITPAIDNDNAKKVA